MGASEGSGGDGAVAVGVAAGRGEADAGEPGAVDEEGAADAGAGGTTLGGCAGSGRASRDAVESGAPGSALALAGSLAVAAAVAVAAAGLVAEAMVGEGSGPAATEPGRSLLFAVSSA